MYLKQLLNRIFCSKIRPDSLPIESRLEKFITIINHDYGNLNSFLRQQSINANGDPIPWFTYPSIEYLDQLDLKCKSVLEWGIGNSTLYFARKCEHIISIEHNADWFNKIRLSLPKNAISYLIEEEKYDLFPLELNQDFDIIIIDGIKRLECLRNAIKLLKPDGFIILDNSDRYPEYCKEVRNSNFIQIDFHGFGPIVNFTTTTSLFLTRSINLTPVGKQPLVPIGGGY